MGATEEIEDFVLRHGVISVADHPRWARTIQRMSVRGLLARILPGVYGPANTASEFNIRVLAVFAKDPDAVITGQAALVLAGVASSTTLIEFHSRRQLRLPAGYRQVHCPIPEDLVITRESLRFAHPQWVAVEMADRDGGAAIDDSLRLRRATLDSLNAAFARFKRRRGNVIRRRILWESRDEPWSQGERAVHQILRSHRILGWVTNFSVLCDGRHRFVDIAFPKLRLAIEFDGREAHSSALAFDDDRERQNALVAQGWTVLRITWSMLHDPERIVTMVKQVIARLSRRFRPATT